MLHDSFDRHQCCRCTKYRAINKTWLLMCLFCPAMLVMSASLNPPSSVCASNRRLVLLLAAAAIPLSVSVGGPDFPPLPYFLSDRKCSRLPFLINFLTRSPTLLGPNFVFNYFFASHLCFAHSAVKKRSQESGQSTQFAACSGLSPPCTTRRWPNGVASPAVSGLAGTTGGSSGHV